jgi:hypothetical protein
MNNRMETIRNFNQILLSIAGIIGILFLITACSLFIIDLWPREYKEKGMIADEEVEILNEQGLRKEIVSFEIFQVADSVNQILILPVTQASLDNPESSDKSLNLINGFTGGYYGELVYNNIAVHYGRSDSTVIVFKDRLSLGEYMISSKKNFLIASGCKRDTNGDKFLNSRDLQNLYIYGLQNKKTQQIKTPDNYTTLQVYEPKETNIILFKFGVDRNENGEFEDNIEPTVYMKLNPVNMNLIPIVNQTNIEYLQKILEGK